jgi:hypothetical protein
MKNDSCNALYIIIFILPGNQANHLLIMANVFVSVKVVLYKSFFTKSPADPERFGLVISGP